MYTNNHYKIQTDSSLKLNQNFFNLIPLVLLVDSLTWRQKLFVTSKRGDDIQGNQSRQVNNTHYSIVKNIKEFVKHWEVKTGRTSICILRKWTVCKINLLNSTMSWKNTTFFTMSFLFSQQNERAFFCKANLSIFMTYTKQDCLFFFSFLFFILNFS